MHEEEARLLACEVIVEGGDVGPVPPKRVEERRHFGGDQYEVAVVIARPSSADWDFTAVATPNEGGTGLP